jgi:quercetin dioxygenase-like cupin family protein
VYSHPPSGDAPTAEARPAGLPEPSSLPQLSDISVGGDPLAYHHPAAHRPRPPRTVADFAGLARAIAADTARWSGLVRYDPVSRWYHRLETGPGHEVWLLTWLPGQRSGLHDHGPSSGVLTVLRGTLTERSLTRSGESTRDLRPGTQRVFGPGYLHEAANNSLHPVVSLHVYWPGLTEMTPYPDRPPHTASESASPVAGGPPREATAPHALASEAP